MPLLHFLSEDIHLYCWCWQELSHAGSTRLGDITVANHYSGVDQIILDFFTIAQIAKEHMLATGPLPFSVATDIPYRYTVDCCLLVSWASHEHFKLDHHPLNLSDHFPVTITTDIGQMSPTPTPDCDYHVQLNWKKFVELQVVLLCYTQ